MYVMEIIDAIPYGYRTEKDDNSKPSFFKSRQTRLTLAQINKLRILNDVRKFEREGKIDGIKNQYAPAVDPGAAGLGGLM
jgi:hypothetical protein